MSVQIVRFSTGPDRVHEVEDGIARLFDALREAAPAGLDYSAMRVGDGPEFLLVLRLADSETNPLLAVPAALEFRAQIADWAGGPVPPEPVEVLGRYAG